MVSTMCALLFLLSFFAPISAEFNKAAEYHYMPDRVRILASVLAGICSGLATVVAFFNNSYHQWQNGKKPEIKP